MMMMVVVVVMMDSGGGGGDGYDMLTTWPSGGLGCVCWGYALDTCS